jgi:selenocysteine-specific elongation factor
MPAASETTSSDLVPPARSLVVATAGHIDHGKTRLVGALTGIDTDRLPEEKRRGITIDLGFASMEIEQPDGMPLRISFVDVPGHSLFIRNMLAGAGCVAAVMLVIAADEGIKPQTIEHLAICELLGITRGITVVTKIDSVSEGHLDEVTLAIKALLRGTFLDRDDAPIVPVSAQTGYGLAGLRAELVNLALRTHAASSVAPLRLPLDRAFVMKGFGTVVTGTLLSGSIHEGESLVLEPGGRSVRVRGLQTHGQMAPTVSGGTRVAVNLSGVEVSDVRRGQTAVAPNTVSAVAMFDAEIRILPAAPPLKHRARVHFHAFTSEGMARVSIYGYEDVRPGGSCIVRIKLDELVVLVPGDRFVLRQSAPVATIGGGRILDCHPLQRQPKSETLAWLKLLSNAPIPEQLAMRVKRRGSAGLPLDALAREAGLTLDATRRHLSQALERRDILLLESDLLLNGDALQAATKQVVTLLSRLARDASASGIKSSELRSQATLGTEVFDHVVSDLAGQRKIQIQGERISLESGPVASSLESEQLALIAQAYEEAGLAAPSVPELAQRLRLSEAGMRRFITLLQRQKTIVRMGSDDLFIHVDALDDLATRMAAMRGNLIDVAAFKQLTGLSRKYAIPLLEYLDRIRITRKQGDQRVIL